MSEKPKYQEQPDIIKLILAKKKGVSAGSAAIAYMKIQQALKEMEK